MLTINNFIFVENIFYRKIIPVKLLSAKMHFDVFATFSHEVGNDFNLPIHDFY